ncbi:MAG: alpha/beta hydrolase [Oscillospiraceae bacterium]|nr:alpha/beta hydrolase [Oscillospiraceae bacterium]
MPFIAISLLLITVTLTVSYCTYRRCFYSRPGHHNDPYEPLRGEQFKPIEETLFRVISVMERYPFEDVGITSHDGVPLRGRYYHFADGAPLLILCHGYRSSALRDCCGGHALSRKMGFNVLAVHQRCHGESGGRTITFGIRERHDVVSWCRWANERFGPNTPIMLYGLSMGAATVLMGCKAGYPDNVVCIMADSPYAAPADIILKVCKDLHYPPKLAYPFIWLGALFFGGFRLDSCTARDAVRHAKVPVLLIHGEDDRLVPCEMSRIIADHCASPVTVRTFPDAAHGLSYMTDPERFEQIVFDFLNKIPEISPFIPEDFKKAMK